MDKQLLTSVCNQIYKRFPEVKGCQPKVLPQNTQYLLVFHGTAQTPDGHSIQRTVRAVVNQNGKVSKVTTSR